MTWLRLCRCGRSTETTKDRTGRGVSLPDCAHCPPRRPAPEGAHAAFVGRAENFLDDLEFPLFDDVESRTPWLRRGSDSWHDLVAQCASMQTELAEVGEDYANMLRWHDLAVARAEAAEARLAAVIAWIDRADAGEWAELNELRAAATGDTA